MAEQNISPPTDDARARAVEARLDDIKRTIAPWREGERPFLETLRRTAYWFATQEQDWDDRYSPRPAHADTIEAIREAVNALAAPPTASQVGREEIAQIVSDALDSAIPEPWEVSRHAADRILALPNPRAEAAEARVRVLEEALRPFAKLSYLLDPTALLENGYWLSVPRPSWPKRVPVLPADFVQLGPRDIYLAAKLLDMLPALASPTEATDA